MLVILELLRRGHKHAPDSERIKRGEGFGGGTLKEKANGKDKTEPHPSSRGEMKEYWGLNGFIRGGSLSR